MTKAEIEQAAEEFKFGKIELTDKGAVIDTLTAFALSQVLLAFEEAAKIAKQHREYGIRPSMGSANGSIMAEAIEEAIRAAAPKE